MRHAIRQLTEYIKQQGYTPTSFAEIGSRDGHDTNYVARYWGITPNRCYIFEAHPDCFSFIKQTYPTFNTFGVAVSNKTEPVSFHAARIGEETNVGISSVLDRDKPEWVSDLITVDGWRMDDIIKQLHLPTIDLVKIDVEGLGLEVLEGFGDLLQNVKYIQIELETIEVWKGQTLYEDVVAFMGSQNFSVADNVVLSHNQNDTLFVNNTL